MNISDHVTYREAVKSYTASKLGISNTPNQEALSNMRAIAMKVFEPIRAYFKRPIYISSFYRSPKLNKAIGGAKNSQHVKGQAIDIDCDSINREIFDFIKDNLVFDQLIYEHGDDNAPEWVHVSFVTDRRNRMQVLRAVKSSGVTKYLSY